MPSANAAIGIPFEFKIPADGLPNRYGSSVPGHEIHWTLQISAPMKGVQYRAAFPIDVAATESRSNDADEDEERELAAARRHASLEDAFAGQARPESARAGALRYIVPVIGGLIFAAGCYSTWNQFAYGLDGVVLSGMLAGERARPREQVHRLWVRGTTRRRPVHRWSAAAMSPVRRRRPAQARPD